MLEYLKNYYIFMLILMILSYMVPKDEYKAYIQFFVGVFMLVILLKPILELLTMDNQNLIYEIFEEINEKIEGVSHEFVFFEGEGE